MVTYKIHIHTGTKPGAETESNVFINLIGTNGDSGKRRLHQSRSRKVRLHHGQVKISHQLLAAIIPLVFFTEDMQTENS